MRRQSDRQTHLYLWARLYVGQLAASICTDSSLEGSQQRIGGDDPLETHQGKNKNPRP